MPSARSVPRAARRLSELRRVGRAAAREYGGSAGLMAARAQVLRWRGGYEIGEAFRRGLLDPSLGAEARAGYVSKHRLLELQRRVNPEALAPLTENKVVFQRHAEALGLPVPPLVAVLAPRGTGWSTGGAVAGDAGWERVFLQEAPDETVLKPAGGYHGDGVRVLRRSGARLAGSDGAALAPAELRACLAAGTESHYLLQERVRNHAAIAELTGVETLQTARMVTLLGGGGQAELLFAIFRLALAGADVDNQAAGALPNGSAEVVDLDTGRLGRLGRPHPLGGGLESHDLHPRTGMLVTGFALPGWDAACELVQRGARAFAPSRTIGWDIAFTADGPLVVEANAFWNPQSGPWMGAVVERIARGAASAG